MNTEAARAVAAARVALKGIELSVEVSSEVDGYEVHTKLGDRSFVCWVTNQTEQELLPVSLASGIESLVEEAIRKAME